METCISTLCNKNDKLLSTDRKVKKHKEINKERKKERNRN